MGEQTKTLNDFGQVISLDLCFYFPRGRDSEDFNLKEVNDAAKEIHCAHISNQVLLPDFSILAWAPVEPSFSARFSYHGQTYCHFPLVLI